MNITKTSLSDLYLTQKLSIRKVATFLNISPSGVRYWLEAFNIPIRSKSEAQTKELNHHYKKRGEQSYRYGIKHSDETKQLMSLAKQGSLNPAYGKERKDLQEKFIGPGNPFFGKKHAEQLKKQFSIQRNRGLTKISKLIRTTLEYTQWRFTCLNRDQFQCLDCKSKKNLQVDHIKQFALILKEHSISSIEDAVKCNELWNTDNGRTLCYSCHRQTKTWGNKIS